MLYAALQEAKHLEEGKRIVIILADSIRNFMTKFVSEDWMYEHGFISEAEMLDANTPKLVPNKSWGQNVKVKDMKLVKPKTLTEEHSIGQAIDMLGNNGFDQAPVLDDSGKIIGVTTTAIITEKLVKNKVTLKDSILLAMTKEYRNVSSDVPLSELGRLLGIRSYVIIDGEYIATSADLLEFYKENH